MFLVFMAVLYSCGRDDVARLTKFDFSRTHLYSNIAIPTGQAGEYGFTVNGLWNGWGVKNPVASMHPGLLHWNLKNPQKYVSDTHDAGFYHGSTLSCVYLDKKIVDKSDELTDGINFSITGEPFIDGRGQYYMRQNSPAWQTYLAERAEQIIDSGSDLLVFDEPFGDTFFGAVPNPAFPGFAEADIRLFLDELDEEYSDEDLTETFGLSRPLTEEKLIRAFEALPWEQLLAGDTGQKSAAFRLWIRYRNFQLRANYLSKKKLCEAIREYSTENRGSAIPIGANLAGLENYSLFALPMPVLYMAGLFDFLACEIDFRPPLKERSTSDTRELFDLSKRAKWYPWYALGQAAVGQGKMLAYPSQELIDSRLEPEKKINYFCHLIAEAYASGGGFIIPLFEMSESDEKKVQSYTNFIKNNPEYYESAVMPASVGILYPHGEGSTPAHHAYLSSAQALYDSGIAYTCLLFSSSAGDIAPLNLERLAGFELLILPFSNTLSPRDRKTLNAYLNNGGKIIVFDDGLDTAENIIVFDSSDYFASYDDSIRKRLAGIIEEEAPGQSIIKSIENNREWTAQLYLKEDNDEAIIHLVNYDYNEANDSFRRKENLKIELNTRDLDFLKASDLVCYARSPDSDKEEKIPVTLKADSVSITVPELDMYKVIILGTS